MSKGQRGLSVSSVQAVQVRGAQHLPASHSAMKWLNTTQWEPSTLECHPVKGMLRWKFLQVTTPTQQQQQALAKSSGGRGGGSAAPPEAENAVAEVLENTLWNRQLGVMSEEIVAALVCQIFEGGVLCACTMTWEPEILRASKKAAVWSSTCTLWDSRKAILITRSLIGARLQIWSPEIFISPQSETGLLAHAQASGTMWCRQWS